MIYDNTTGELKPLAGSPAARLQAIEDNIAVNENVYGAKNLIPFPYHRQNGYTTNGATFTYDDEGVVTVNKVVGSVTAYFAFFSNILYPNAKKILEPNTSYILSMELEDATNTSCFIQTQNGSDIAAIRNKATGKYETLFTTTETIDSLTIGLYYGAETAENNAKVKLMIRLASIQDDTWVPYVPTNKELMSCKLNGYVGAKNLLAYPYKHTTKSENGVTFTDNGDGTITVNTPTSASAETTFYLSQSIQSILDTGMYILSGCPSGGNRTSGYFMEFAELATSSSNWKMFGTDTGEGAIAHIDSTRYAIHAYIRIRSGATVSNLTFKPMIRRVEDTDPTYQPYAMTNRELTDKVSELDGSWVDITSDASDYVNSGYIKYKKIGQLVIVKMWDVIFKSDGSGNILSTNLPTCDDNATNRIFRDQREGLGALYMNNNSKNLYCHHANPSGDTTQTKWYGEMVYTTSD